MARPYNFSAGPAMLPDSVLTQARDEMLDWHGSGMCVAEMSHRGKEYMSIAAAAEADLRALLAIPDNYKVLFLQGGASSQFAMVPMNLLRHGQDAAYIKTGSWSKKAIQEAKRYCTVAVTEGGIEGRFTSVPAQVDLLLGDDASYVHYTPNETIEGVEFPYISETGDIPLVADKPTIVPEELDHPTGDGRAVRLRVAGGVGFDIPQVAAPVIDPETGAIIGDSPFMSSLVFLLMLTFLVMGLAYGFGAQTIKSADDAINAITKTLADLGGLLFLFFVISQFVAYFNYSNMGTILAVRLADSLKEASLSS